METLREFLQFQADEWERTTDERLSTIEEWKGAIDRLIALVQGWVEESDRNHILEVEPEYRQIREEKLGAYVAPGLVIKLRATVIKLLPISRYNVGPYLKDGEIRVNRSYGRMDLTGGGEKYLLYRHEIDPADVWYIVDDKRYVPHKLDRETFEQALLDLLR